MGSRRRLCMRPRIPAPVAPLIVGLVAVWQIGSATAVPQSNAGEQLSTWSFSIGVAYQFFEDAKFGGQEFTGWGLETVGTPVTGAGDTAENLAAAQLNGPYGVQGLRSPLDPGAVTMAPTFELANDTFGVSVPLDYVRYDGSRIDSGLGSQTGMFVAVHRELSRRGNWTFSFTGDVQYVGLDVSEGHAGTMFAPDAFTAEQYRHVLVDVDPTAFDGTISGAINPTSLPATAPVPGTDTEFSVDSELDLDMFVLSLGLTASVGEGRLRMNMTVGPTVTIGDMSSSQTLRSSWGDIDASYPDPPFSSPLAVVNAGSSTEVRRDSDTDVFLGAFAELGLSFALTPNWDTRIDLRCDAGHREFTTNQASLRASRYSLRVCLVARF